MICLPLHFFLPLDLKNKYYQPHSAAKNIKQESISTELSRMPGIEQSLKVWIFWDFCFQYHLIHTSFCQALLPQCSNRCEITSGLLIFRESEAQRANKDPDSHSWQMINSEANSGGTSLEVLAWGNAAIQSQLKFQELSHKSLYKTCHSSAIFLWSGHVLRITRRP